ncbi:MAG TPA: class I SAM-dependent methyltransferase [Phycicoccus elongatus]|uniref:class I SAM-dependent methyltransferase n=1 Tax=Phycicoccus TaxID=367298 RepID=UPI002C772570|nr:MULTISPECIES: class I SAM-dependent methyltransferase [Phycicoccus]MBK8729376.1 class I SAM-dependent methyltransferase [Tetrasphaera sp.]HPF75357.1 class I SAM-dependent methyltransferase [Phycicoccus elongatus]HPK11596.1 class I SAM-dependent methyltransferase [Phycicoccus elongatus]HRC17158.1 class I SAM-dependent methyltransferase [Phycicoccus elongatus]HRV56551.1 class I SAM-dependent methyltransferase [Phycicoccus sp.]
MASGPEPLGRGTIPSPNLWRSPEVYELENLASDRAGVIDAAIGALHPWAGARVLDVGCGSGFHLPQFASYAAAPLGVEPHLPLAVAARDRLRGSGIGVIAGSAEALPLADASMDIAHARWAYFFGPGCERGLAEVDRVLRPGGLAVFVDNDVSAESTFSRWFAAAYPAYDPEGVERFWRRQGFETQRLVIEWTFERREDLAAVIGIEFPPEAAARFVDECTDRADRAGHTVDYAIALRWRHQNPTSA